MEINIQATQGVCSEFMGEDGERREVSVVISPLKVAGSEDQSKISIVTGCNMWKSCHNEGCYYSLASRIKKERSKNSD
ncbi:unnamed protein product [marine sediment metagenome]|uniref:Uncharacterized protein n=1 Tax=marine sediment metagenome TaxID=412755 RepID=X1TJN0_9ZZZZ